MKINLLGIIKMYYIRFINLKQNIMKNHLENIVFNINGFFVEKITQNNLPLYHVFMKGVTHATCDSAYKDVDYAIVRCKYLEKELNDSKTKRTLN